jgi:hypothetical protein
VAISRILLIFIDGLGLGGDDLKANPLKGHPDLWPTENHSPERSGLDWKPIDACLGIEGLPQSATGQTALLTGINAPQVIGRHLQGFPSKALIHILKQESIFVKLTACGKKATFANAYRRPEDISPASRLSVTSHAFKASGQDFRSIEQMEKKEALYHEFTNRELIARNYDVPEFTPEQAAEILLNIAGKHHFTLYEHFMTDVVAHRGKRSDITRQVDCLSHFVRSVLGQIDPERLTVILTSDHGNIEDLTVRTHTRHPVPLIWTGSSSINPDKAPQDVTVITPCILQLLGCTNE